MPQNPYLQKLPAASETIYSVPPQCLVYLNVSNNEAAKLLSTSHDAGRLHSQTEWLAGCSHRESVGVSCEIWCKRPHSYVQTVPLQFIIDVSFF